MANRFGWHRRFTDFLTVWALLWIPSVSFADMTSVQVRLQSGQVVAIQELPLIRIIRLYPFGQQVFSNSSLVFYQHILFSPPTYCPHGWYWSWSAGFTEQMIDQRREICNREQRAKLTFLPEQDRGICDCKLVLKTEKVKAIGQEPMMQSLDDGVLVNDQYKVARRLRHGDEFLPVLVSLSGAGHGEFFDYAGNALCRGKRRLDNEVKRGLDEMLRLIRSGQVQPVRIECLGGREGYVDFSQLSYSVLRQRLEGVIRVKFDNGESYDVVQ